MAILIAAMCLSPYVVAEDIYQTTTMGGTHNWTESDYWSGAAPSDYTSNNYIVGPEASSKITFRTRTINLTGGYDTFPDGNTLWMGYNMDMSTFSAYQAELAVKAPTFYVNNLQLGNAFINKACSTGDTVTLAGNTPAGKMTVNGTVVFGFASSVDNKIDVQIPIEGAGEITISKEDKKFNKDNLKISHANNAFKGTLNVTEGCSVLLNAENAMINASSFIINSEATLKLQGHQSSLNNLSGSGTVSFTGDALTLNNIATQVPLLSGNTEFSGVISGSASAEGLTVNKTGNGMLTFSGSGMYSGKTNVQAGTLRLAGNAFNDNWQIDVSSGATLEYFVDSGETETVTLSADNKITCDDGTVAKTGAGALTLTGAKTYTGETKVKEGKLILTGDAIVDNGPITVNNDGTLEYNLASGQTKKLTITDINKIVSTGEVIKTGEGTLQLCIEAQGGVDIQSLTVSSGHVDIKGYMIGHITVDANGVFSPGNSVGEATFGGGFILNEGAELLIEVDRTGADVLACKTFTWNNGTVKLDWQDDEIPFLATCDIIVSESSDLTNVYNNLKDHFDFSTSPTVARLYNDGYITISLAGDNNNIIKLSIDRNAVPEPSTWALLVLGAAGLLYVRKRKN